MKKNGVTGEVIRRVVFENRADYRTFGKRGDSSGRALRKNCCSRADARKFEKFAASPGAVATVMAMKPWYTRFESPITLKLPGRPPTEGKGTLEYFELK